METLDGRYGWVDGMTLFECIFLDLRDNLRIEVVMIMEVPAVGVCRAGSPLFSHKIHRDEKWSTQMTRPNAFCFLG